MSARRLIATAVAVLALGAAAPAGAASWRTPTTLPGAGDVNSSVAVGTDGTAAIAYVAGGVRVAVRNAGGRWGTPVRVSQGSFNVTGPSVAVDGKGGVIVAWTQDGNPRGGGLVRGPLTIRTIIRARSGAWGTVHLIGTSSHFIEANAKVAANAAGDAIITWSGVRQLGGTRRTLAVQSSYRPATRPFGGAQTIREPETPNGISGGVVAIDDRGTAYAAWTNDAGPVVRIAARSRGASGSWGSQRTIGPAQASNPVIALTPAREAIVAWHDAGVDSEGNGLQTGPLMTASRLPSGALSAVTQVASTQTRDYELAVAPSGEAMLTLGSRPTGSEDVTLFQVAVRPAGAAQFGPAAAVPGVLPGGALTYLADATALYVWNTSTAVLSVARPAGGAFGDQQQVAEPGLYPRVGATGNTAVAVWSVASGERVRIATADRR
ncbi:MAG TPA: hypothetical protein VII98_04145 [Solirubrobacteraceae bacterium]